MSPDAAPGTRKQIIGRLIAVDLLILEDMGVAPIQEVATG
jgi:hypothetical protein